MQERETKNCDQSVTDEQERAQTTAKHGRKSYSKKSGKASSQSRGKGRRANGGKKQQSDRRRTACKKERLFNRRQVSEIIRHRINSLNNRIEELELELAILRADALLKEMKENGTNNGN